MGKIERIEVPPEDRERLVKLVRDRNTPQKIVWRFADRAFGRRGDWRGRGGEEGGQERAHRAPLAATLRGQGGGGVVEGRDPPGRAQAADSEENQASREPDAQREAVGRHPLERTHDGGTGWHRAVVGT